MSAIGTIAVDFRTTDNSRWGVGTGRGTNGNLTATQADQNLWNLAQAVFALQSAPPPTPNNIANITVSGMTMTVTLLDGTQIGPLALPVLSYRARGAWAPDTSYAALDNFTVPGLGLYLVLLPHTSAATFNAGATDSNGNTLYQLVLGAGELASPYTYFAPISGATVAAPAGVVRVICNPTATLASLSLVLPPNPAGGALFELLTSQAITSLVASPGSGETVEGNSLSLTVGSSASWVYDQPLNTWFRRSGGASGGGGGSSSVTIPTSHKTGNYTALAGDAGCLLEFELSAPATLTLNTPGAGYFPAGSTLFVQNNSNNTGTLEGALTITPGGSASINASFLVGASLVIGAGQGCLLISDGANWSALVTSTGGGGGQVDHTSTLSTTSSGAIVMVGIGLTMPVQRTGNVLVVVSAEIVSGGGSGISVQLRTGTGTAPANGASIAGSAIGVQRNLPSGTLAFSLNEFVSQIAAPGTDIWFDLGFFAFGGTLVIDNISASVIEA